MLSCQIHIRSRRRPMSNELIPLGLSLLISKALVLILVFHDLSHQESIRGSFGRPHLIYFYVNTPRPMAVK